MWRISSIAIAVLGFLVWGHHLFVAGQSMYASMVFSLLSFLVAIPSAIKVFNWTATMYKGSISFETPMLYAFGFIGLFTIGGLTGLFLATMAIDVHVTDTYFVIAHFHYVMVGGMVMAYLGGIHFWFPEDLRPHVSGGLGEIRGAGRLRRIQPDVLSAVHSRIPGHAAALCTLPAGVSGVECDVDGGRFDPGGRLPAPDDLPGVGLAKRPKAPQNPWNAKGLEWEQSPTPPPNLQLRNPPVVTEPAYNYSGDEQEVESWRDSEATACGARAGACSTISTTAPSSFESSTLGMWVFLITEVMFFGGMFGGYTVYRNMYPGCLRLHQPVS